MTLPEALLSCRRHEWLMLAPDRWECGRCRKPRDMARMRRGRQSRGYGNRAELDAARRYGGTKVGHHGGPVDVQGTDFDTQVKTHRRPVPREWSRAFAGMAQGTRMPRLLLRFVAVGRPPEDYFVVRAEDWLAWHGRDEP